MKRIFWFAVCFGFINIISSFKKTPDANTYVVLVDKSDNILQVYEEDECLVTYPVVFGTWDKSDKMMQGDKKTPEGTYHIQSKRLHPKWSRFMLLDYPNKEDIEKFNHRKAEGLIPSSAKIGGAIGIHGTWPKEDFAIDYKQQWTEGCVSTKNKYIQKLYEVLPVGTTVYIQQ